MSLISALLNIILFPVCIFFSCNSYGQDRHNPASFEKNKIRIIEGYIFLNENVTDSFLITKEYFNTKGRRIKIEIYDSLGLKSEYLYNYANDTLKLSRITKFRGKIHSIMRMDYDDNNREIKAVDWTSTGVKSGTYSITKYNDRKRTKEVKIYIYKRLVIHTKEYYHSDGSTKSIFKKIKGKWIEQSIPGFYSDCKIEVIENFRNTGLKLEKTTEVFPEKKIILGLNGRLEIKANDMLVGEKYTNDQGLIVMEKQFLNGQFISLKKYKYFN